MFTVYEYDGTRSPYQPGFFRKRIEEIDPSKAGPQSRGGHRHLKKRPQSQDAMQTIESYSHADKIPRKREPAIKASQIMSHPVFSIQYDKNFN